MVGWSQHCGAQSLTSNCCRVHSAKFDLTFRHACKHRSHDLPDKPRSKACLARSLKTLAFIIRSVCKLVSFTATACSLCTSLRRCIPAHTQPHAKVRTHSAPCICNEQTHLVVILSSPILVNTILISTILTSTILSLTCLPAKSICCNDTAMAESHAVPRSMASHCLCRTEIRTCPSLSMAISSSGPAWHCSVGLLTNRSNYGYNLRMPFNASLSSACICGRGLVCRPNLCYVAGAAD